MMTDNGSGGIGDALIDEMKRICAGCKIHKSHWKENNGEGYPKNKVIYCCRDCSEGIECMCNLIQV
jgi:hypothetical protein